MRRERPVVTSLRSWLIANWKWRVRGERERSIVLWLWRGRADLRGEDDFTREMKIYYSSVKLGCSDLPPISNRPLLSVINSRIDFLLQPLFLTSSTSIATSYHIIACPSWKTSTLPQWAEDCGDVDQCLHDTRYYSPAKLSFLPWQYGYGHKTLGELRQLNKCNRRVERLIMLLLERMLSQRKDNNAYMVYVQMVQGARRYRMHQIQIIFCKSLEHSKYATIISRGWLT